jgi:hypothetical protein
VEANHLLGGRRKRLIGVEVGSNKMIIQGILRCQPSLVDLGRTTAVRACGRRIATGLVLMTAGIRPEGLPAR